jgi:hypothetical protein
MAAEFGWTRSSYYLLSAFLATLFLLAYVWWPLAEEYLEQIDASRSLWRQIDWLLIGIFLAMSGLIMAGADIRQDVWILSVGLAGGLVIESWGTQTELWTYYTLERPPLWIIPAWPIASLSIDRLVRISDRFLFTGRGSGRTVLAYWLLFPAFMGLMVFFVWPTIDKPLTLAALFLCGFLILTPVDHRLAIITFAATLIRRFSPWDGRGRFLENRVASQTAYYQALYRRSFPGLFLRKGVLKPPSHGR